MYVTDKTTNSNLQFADDKLNGFFFLSTQRH